ncbi:MAG: transposase [Planctomycetes bacterium]|nr:transposase [Planctomycetota bacterium]
MPEEVEFQTKPEIALGQIDRALANGVRVAAWTFDELYGRDGKFLDGMESREQVFVGEVPVDFHGWVREPKVLPEGPENTGNGRPKRYPRLVAGYHSSEVRNLTKYSPVFRKQAWQRYRIKDSQKGPEVWEIKWAVFWRKDRNGLPGRPHTLIVACNVLSGEMKYFVSNRVPGEEGVTLKWLLWVAFGRWPVERCFRETKDELGMDHFQVRGWRCVHRHYYITQLSQLFCARVRQEYEQEQGDTEARLTIEQVRGAACVHLEAASLKPTARRERYQQELDKIDYHQRRNRQACKSHTKTRINRLLQLGIDVDQLPTCQPDDW